MPTTPYVEPIGEAGSGEVLVSREFSLGKEFGKRVRNQVMTLNEAVALLGPAVVSRFIDNLDWADWDDLRELNKEPSVGGSLF